MELISRSVGKLMLDVVVSCNVFEIVDESQVVVVLGDWFGISTAVSGVLTLTDTLFSHVDRLSWLTGHTCGSCVVD